VALQGYAYALKYSENPITDQVTLVAVVSAGQLTPTLTQASVVCKHSCSKSFMHAYCASWTSYLSPYAYIVQYDVASCIVHTLVLDA